MVLLLLPPPRARLVSSGLVGGGLVEKGKGGKVELTDVIRNRVRKALVLALPPKELDGFIQAEWDKFFKEEGRDYHSTRPAPFRVMLREEIADQVKTQLKKWMDENFTKVWSGQEELIVGDMVKKFAPIVVQELASKLASEALEAIYQRLRP